MKDVDLLKSWSWFVNPHFTSHIERERWRDTLHLWVRDVICCLCAYQLSSNIELNPAALLLSNLSFESWWARNVLTVVWPSTFNEHWIESRSAEKENSSKLLPIFVSRLLKRHAFKWQKLAWKQIRSSGVWLAVFLHCENGEFWKF